MGPFLRLWWWRTSRLRGCFFWTHHPVLLFVCTLSLLLRVLRLEYRARQRGERVELRKAPQYSRYINWLSSRDNSQSRAFWQRYLKGSARGGALAGSMQLETNSPDYQHYERAISEASSAALRDIVRQQHITLSVIVQAAWAIVLSRHVGQSDVTFGATVSGRPAELEGVEQVVGPFINAVPIRIRLNEALDLPAWLEEIQQELQALMDHQWSSLVEVQAYADARPGEQIIDTLLVFENYPVSLVSVGEPKFLRIQSFGQANYPLTIGVAPDERLAFRFSYDRNRLPERVIASLFRRLERVLSHMGARPRDRLADFGVLSDAEVEDLTVGRNSTAREYPRDSTIDQIIQAAAAERGDAIAVALGQDHLSYRELTERANQLSHHLVSLGVRREQVVGVMTSRSLESVLCVLAIWKAGATYLPLDADYPAPRLEHMVRDSGAVLVLIRRDVMFAMQSDVRRVYVDGELERISWRPRAKSAMPALAEQSAYIIYTSGSTGMPKGVEVSHRCICNLQQLERFRLGVGARDRVLQFASSSFDAAIWELCASLCAGGTLVLADTHQLKSAEGLRSLLREQSITQVTLPPTMLSELDGDLPGLQCIVSAGEACSAELVRRWAPGRRFINAYGPTECTVCATMAECDASDVEAPSIGSALDNTRVYVLGDSWGPVPVGCNGELYVAGDGVATGYHGLAALTAERFLPDPYAVRPGARMYRTGDVVRWRERGDLIYVGRTDHQVKVRGHRVELSEVEHALGAHSNVSQCIVEARSDRGRDELVAYVAWKEAKATIGELREYARSRLPEFMVPSRFVEIDRFPLTHNGKVDRRALPSPARGRAEVDTIYVAPSTETEKALAGICRELLHVDQIGVHDSFFDLGANSLVVTQLATRIKNFFGVELPLRVAFQHATVAGLAAAMRADPATGESVEETARILNEMIESDAMSDGEALDAVAEE
jgi:amino acid adenylation domain-containing protein